MLPNLPAYRLLERRQSDGAYALWCAIRQADDRRVLIKTSLTDEAGIVLRREYELLRQLQLSGVLQPIAFEQYRGHSAIVFDDFPGRSLLDLAGDVPLAVDEFLEIATALAQSLSEVHAKRVIHKQLKLASVLVDVESGEIKLIGFDLAEHLGGSPSPSEVTGEVRGALAYVSPEQTGRLNSGIDCRSDLYSLGVIFYRLLAGKLPFDSSNPAELIYLHIAREPEPLARLRPDVPQTLSHIIQRLLAKEPGSRYQSAYGLWRDLAPCLEQLRSSGEIAPFALGGHDISQELRISSRIYGRAHESEEIRAAVRNGVNGSGEVVFISGSAGVGKSTLASDAGRTVLAHGGRFASGKFDQLRRDIPYSAFIEAFQELIRQLLAEDRASFDKWREQIRGALPFHAQVVVQVLPQLELLLGPRAAVPPLGSEETTTRFQLAMCQLVRAFATRDHPLVLLLDDLQWADSASVNLVRLLMADREIGHLTLLAAYRDNETQALGPLSMLLRDAPGWKRQQRTVQLSGLDAADIENLLGDALSAAAQETAPLARTVLAKTQGNAFFVKEFVTALYRNELLQFDPRAGAWRWELSAIAAQDVTGNVVDFVRHRLDLLPGRTQEVLRLAAVIGNRFSTGTLATVCEQPIDHLRIDLARAVAQELIVRIGDWSGTEEASETYRFVHDRIQQASYAQIAADDRPILHQRVGRLLRDASSEGELEERLFEIANHLNVAGALPDDEGGRLGLAALNLRAARKAKSSAAYDTAARYLEVALRLVTDADWEQHYTLLFGFYRETTEVAYLLGRYGDMQQHADVALAHARSVLDRVELLEIIIRYYNSSMKFTQAVEMGLEATKLLGETLPANPTKARVGVALIATRLKLHRRQSELRQLPEMKDPVKLAAMRVMALTASAAYFARPNLLALITFRMVEMSVRHGAASLSAFAFVCYGLLLCAVTGRMDAGYEYGKLALAMLDRLNARELRAKIIFLFNVFIAHWTQDMGGSDEQFLDAAASGLETGDLEYFSYSLYMHCGLKLIDGRSLEEVNKELQSHHQLVAKHKQDKVELLFRMVAAVVAELRGVPAVDPAPPDAFDEERAIAVWLERHDYSGLAYLYCFQTFRHFVAGEYQRSAASAELARRSYGSLMGQPFVPFLYTYESLALSELLPALQGARRRAARHRLARNRRDLARWAAHAPANYRRKSLLLDAEWAAAKGQVLVALRRYDEAVAQAARDGALLDEGLAAERAAQFCLNRNLGTAGQQYLAQAIATYARWGAADFRAPIIDRLRRKATQSVLRVEAGSEASHRLRPSEIDFDSVVRATQTLSQQVVLADVLRELLTIASTNAGATRGLLLLVHDGKLSIDAEVESGRSVRLLHAEPVASSDKLSDSVLDYAFRSRTSVVLNNALEEGPFREDPFIRARGIRSLVCLPLHNQAELVGLLYLENNLISQAFTAARLEILRIFAGQAAISIRNAELYAHLESSLAEQVALASVHKRFVPHQFLVALGKQRITDVVVGDKVLKTLSVLFADMRSYSSMSERLSPKEDLEFVNAFFGQIESAIVSNRGFVDNYYGDGIMALFESEADDAVRAGIALLRALYEYNESRERHGMAPVRVGVGINTGEVMLGTIGGATSIKCSVIGDSVNLASRIENLTKHFDASLLIGESTYGALKDPGRYLTRHVGRVRVKGRSRPVTIYEVYDADGPELREAKLASVATFNLACEQYYRRAFADAAAGFENCLSACPRDRTAALFLDRSRANSIGVAEDWDGTETILQY